MACLERRWQLDHLAPSHHSLKSTTTGVYSFHPPPDNGNFIPWIITQQIPLPERIRQPCEPHDTGDLPDTASYNGDLPAGIFLLTISS